MKVARIYTGKVMATTRHTSIVEAAAAMRRYAVGSLLVLESTAPGSKPVGIVTDRDIALEGFASELSEAVGGARRGRGCAQGRGEARGRRPRRR